MLKFQYYKTNHGLFLKDPFFHYTNSPSSEIVKNDHIRINGKPFEFLLRARFFFLEGIHSIDSWEVLEKGGTKVIGYEIKEDVPNSVKAAVKEFYTLEEVGRVWGDDDSGDDGWFFNNSEFKALSHLYKEVTEKKEDYWVKKDFDCVVLGEVSVENLNFPEQMLVTYSDNDSPWIKKNITKDLSHIVSYDDLTQALTPEFLLHLRPCSLSSEQVYKIVRSYIKENIDNKVARITSDYDFCLTVCKLIKIKPYIQRGEILNKKGKSYATPKFHTQEIKSKEHKIFEMAPKIYGNYPIIKPWKADSLQEMYEQMTIYLEELMKEINSEVSECEHCGGIGCIVNNIGTNNRNLK